MVTSALQAKRTARTSYRIDKYFFSAIAILIAVTVSAGFARTYFLAGMFRAHLPGIVVHVHATLFILWIALITTQIALVRTGRVRWHRTLGVVGTVVAPLMVLSGLLTLLGFIRRQAVSLPIMQAIAFGDLLSLCVFSMFFVWGYRVRRDPPAHRRLMLLATFSLLGPAIARWPYMVPGSHWFDFFCLSFPALVAMYDLVTLRSLHRTTVCGVLCAVATQFSGPIAESEAITHLIKWLQRM